MPSVSGHMKKSGVLTGTFQVLTGVPSMFSQHEYLSQIVTSCASSCHLCGSPPATFPVGSAGSRITGLETTVREDRWVHGLCLGGFKISAGQNTSLGRVFPGGSWRAPWTPLPGLWPGCPALQWALNTRWRRLAFGPGETWFQSHLCSWVVLSL